MHNSRMAFYGRKQTKDNFSIEIFTTSLVKAFYGGIYNTHNSSNGVLRRNTQYAQFQQWPFYGGIQNTHNSGNGVLRRNTQYAQFQQCRSTVK